MHISGLLLEGSTDTPVSYSLSMGIGSRLGTTGLKPVEILHPTKEYGRLSASAKLAYKPSADSMDEFGIFTAYTRIPTENISMYMGSTGITQTLAGAGVNQKFDRLRLIAELYVVHNRAEAASAAGNNTFTSGYVQAEYSIQAKWTLFGRVENTANADGNPYLDLYPEFIRSRTLAGTRYALSRNQAFKLELSHSERQDKSRSRQLALEWSAVFP